MIGTSKASAKEYVLFAVGSNGFSQPVSNYDSIVSSLRRGDVVRFTDGKSFKLGRDLHGGRGSMSRIFSVQDPKGAALRFPQSSNPLVLDMINRSIDGYSALSEAGVPTVSVHDSKRRQYVLVDQIQSKFITAEEFFREPNRVSRTMKSKMVNQLIEFAKTTAYFRHIGDFGLSQIVYDAQGERWLLLDWTAGHVSMARQSASGATKNCFEHVFDHVLKDQSRSRKNWITSVQLKINQAIQERQAKIQSSPMLLERLRTIDEKIVPNGRATNTASHAAVSSFQANFMDCLVSGVHHSFDF